jgi:hypothetical protein
MIVAGVIIFIKIKAQQLLASQGAGITLEPPDIWVFHCYFWMQIWFAFDIGLRVGASSIAEDVRTGAFQFYFARPVSAWHYLAGKVAPVAILVLVVSAAPALLLSLLRLALSKDGAEALGALPLVLATLAYAPVYTAVMTLPPVALSALGRRPGAIQGIWAAVFFFSWILGDGMASVTGIQEVALLSLPTCLMLVGQRLYGFTPKYSLPWHRPAGVIAAVLVASVAILLHRLRKVEVFA